MKIITIQQAMQHVADNPQIATDDLLDVKIHELVCRALFEIANAPKADERGSLTRANTARHMIFTRLVGRRRAGSHPATKQKIEVEFINLTGKQVQQ